ncbi:MAG: helix-turn-helix domain-containing protein [Acidobacteriota bacterium]
MRISPDQALVLVTRRLVSLRHGASARPGALAVSLVDRDRLIRWVRSSSTPTRILVRVIVVLMAAAGWSNARCAAELGISRRTAALWRARFTAGGCPALRVDAPGRGRKPGRDPQVVERIIRLSQQRPLSGSHWTVRTLAWAAGTSHSTVHRVLRERSLVSTSRKAQATGDLTPNRAHRRTDTARAHPPRRDALV